MNCNDVNLKTNDKIVNEIIIKCKTRFNIRTHVPLAIHNEDLHNKHCGND